LKEKKLKMQNISGKIFCVCAFFNCIFHLAVQDNDNSIDIIATFKLYRLSDGDENTRRKKQARKLLHFF